MGSAAFRSPDKQAADFPAKRDGGPHPARHPLDCRPENQRGRGDPYLACGTLAGQVRSFVFNKLLGSGFAGLAVSYSFKIGYPLAGLGHALCCNPGALAQRRCNPLFSITCWDPRACQYGCIFLISKWISVNKYNSQGCSRVCSSLENSNVACFQLLVGFARRKKTIH